MADQTQLFSSRLHILAVENEDRVGKTSGKTYRHFAARCVVMDDAGNALTVGTLRSDQIVPELRETVTKETKGIYRAGYGLRVPDYGDAKGDVVCMVTSLVAERPATPAKGS